MERAAITIFLLALAVPLFAQATVSTASTTTPLLTTVGTLCADELIDVTGSVHIVTHTTDNGRGLTSTVFHLNLHGSGIGQDSGLKYEFTQSSHEVFNSRATAALEYTLTETIHVLGGGSADNFRLRAVFHVTINENGELTAEVMEFERICD